MKSHLNYSSATRILLDVSYTISSSRNSGIERVVRNIRNHWMQMATELHLKIVCVVSYAGQFYEVTPELEARFARQAAVNRNVLEILPRPYRWIASLLCGFIRFEFLRRWLLPEPGHLGVFKIMAELCERSIRRGIRKQPRIADFTEQDLIVMPDAYWTEMQAFDAAQQARRNGATIVTVVYDLIPITHPETVGALRSRDFLEYFRQACQTADTLVAISRTVRDEVRAAIPRLLSDNNRSNTNSLCNDVRSFRLGADVPNTESLLASHGQVDHKLRELFDSEPNNKPYLMVSMFDPRKNHRYVLDAFDSLWAQGVPVRLCMVGRKGNLCADVLSRIANHPQLNNRLFVFHQANDADLVFCYQNAAAAMMPSIAEGFGLPIVESLHFGCDTMASDIPVHREVGDSSCQYFNIHDPQSLASMIIQHLKLKTASRPTSGKGSSSNHHITTWRESTEELLALVMNVYREHRAKSPRISRAA
jgi:O-antigen biosynthesis alpha-1,2-rhamnosyltransferase